MLTTLSIITGVIALLLITLHGISFTRKQRNDNTLLGKLDGQQVKIFITYVILISLTAALQIIEDVRKKKADLIISELEEELRISGTVLPSLETLLIRYPSSKSKELANQISETGNAYNDAIKSTALGDFNDALYLLGISETNGDAPIIKTELLRARILAYSGNYNESLMSYRRIFEHEDYDIRWYIELAALNSLSGNFIESENILSHIYKLLRLDGLNSSETEIRVANELAISLASVARYSDADKLFNEIMINIESNHDPLLKADFLDSYASFLLSVSCINKADSLFNASYAIREDVHGINHPETLTSLNNIASINFYLGDIELADSLLNKSHKLRIELLGEDHPSIAESLNNLGALAYAKEVLFNDTIRVSQDYFLEALVKWKQIFGNKHPSVVVTLNNLSDLYAQRGELDKAIKYSRSAMDIGDSLFEDRHPIFARTLNNLGNILYFQGKLDSALYYHQHVQKIRENVFGLNHPDVATSINNQATILFYQNKLEEAYELHQKALAIRLDRLGKNNPYTIQSMDALEQTADSLNIKSPVNDLVSRFNSELPIYCR